MLQFINSAILIFGVSVVIFTVTPHTVMAQDNSPTVAEAPTVVTPQVATPAAAVVVAAPVYGWKRQMNGSLNLNQAYQDNWVKGGTDALAWDLNLSGSAILDQADYNWTSNLKAIYGRTKIQDLAMRQSSDEWGLESIYLRKLNTYANPFASVTAQSQFTPGYAYNDSAHTHTQVSDFFDPAYFTETIGLGATPVKDLKERLGATMKQTTSPNFGYADDKKTLSQIETVKQEYGVSSITEYQFELMQNILAATRLDIFANFKGFDEIDTRWENHITAKINKFVNTNFALEYLYDKDLSEDVQMREGLSIGISFLQL